MLKKKITTKTKRHKFYSVYLIITDLHPDLSMHKVCFIFSPILTVKHVIDQARNIQTNILNYTLLRYSSIYIQILQHNL